MCLSTVDRRSRERFIESNNQIASLVEKFKLEGGAYRKYVGGPQTDENVETHQKIPLTAYGRPGSFSVLLTLIGYDMNNCCSVSRKKYAISLVGGIVWKSVVFYISDLISTVGKIFFFALFYFFSSRSWHQLSPFKLNGMCLRNFFLRLCLLPAFYFLLWIFYYEGFNFDVSY